MKETVRRVAFSVHFRCAAVKLCFCRQQAERQKCVADSSPAGEPVWPSGKKALSPFLTGRMCVRRTYFGQFDKL